MKSNAKQASFIARFPHHVLEVLSYTRLYNYTTFAQHKMADELTNGDDLAPPVNADVEMKEEAPLEVYHNP